MYTQCPHCATVFEIDAALLSQAHGRLCCGVCGHEFDALARLDTRADALGSESSAQAAPPRVEPSRDPAQTELFARPPAPSAPPVPNAPPPSFARAARAPARRSGGWWLAALLLGLTLAVQIVIAQRAELARDAQWRAWLQPLCERIDCRLPVWRDPARVSLVSRNISPHPSVDQALLVSATIRNDAPWPQAWPVLELALSDLDGQPIALRRFSADEYLGGPPPQPTLAPGQTAVAQLEIVDPGKRAVAFEFDFL